MADVAQLLGRGRNALAQQGRLAKDVEQFILNDQALALGHDPANHQVLTLDQAPVAKHHLLAPGGTRQHVFPSRTDEQTGAFHIAFDQVGHSQRQCPRALPSKGHKSHRDRIVNALGNLDHQLGPCRQAGKQQNCG